MEKNTLNMTFPADKLEALEFYLGEKGLTVEGEFQSQMDSLYEKNVPQATRRYLERNDPPDQRTAESGEEPKRKSAMTDDERKEFNARRREQRKTEKAQKEAPEALPAVIPDDAPKQEMVM